ncbi:MAG: acyl-CoA thioesterase [Deltaproteobacteria bacterium]|nr:acyl-CoA thioesterase [Deltaproteobacteria bacterium]
MEFSVDIQVRDSELDLYGVVNNAVYAQYFQHARHEYLHTLGMDAALVAKQGQAWALSELKLRFVTGLVSRDRARVTARVTQVSGVRVVFAQEIVRADGTLAAEAEAVAVMLNGQGRPMRIPPDVRRLLETP